jgi:hypothetical protein
VKFGIAVKRLGDRQFHAAGLETFDVAFEIEVDDPAIAIRKPTERIGQRVGKMLLHKKLVGSVHRRKVGVGRRNNVKRKQPGMKTIQRILVRVARKKPSFGLVFCVNHAGTTVSQVAKSGGKIIQL